MVQELSYESCAMFPGRQGTFNMNLGAYGYQQPYGQDHYGQFNIDTGCLPPQPNTCAWAGVYPTTPTGASAANGRPPSGGPMDDWSYGTSTSQVGPSSGSSQQGTPPSGNLPYYRSSNMSGDYLQPMPSPPIMAPGSPNSGSGQLNYGATQGNQQRPQPSSRAPYDWMKKQSYPTTPASGKSTFHCNSNSAVGDIT